VSAADLMFSQAVIDVDGEKAKLLADLTLHQSDLLMAINCLATLEALPMLDEWQQTVIPRRSGGRQSRFL
jgi:hypothetical protein